MPDYIFISPTRESGIKEALRRFRELPDVNQVCYLPLYDAEGHES